MRACKNDICLQFRTKWFFSFPPLTPCGQEFKKIYRSFAREGVQQGKNPRTTTKRARQNKTKKSKATDKTDFPPEKKRTRFQLLKPLWILRDRCELTNRSLFLSPAGCVRRHARPRPAATKEGTGCSAGQLQDTPAPEGRHTTHRFVLQLGLCFSSLLALWKFSSAPPE